MRIWIPVNIIGNLYVSNGFSAGNTHPEARTQALSEIVVRHIKFRNICEGPCLPEVLDEDITPRERTNKDNVKGTVKSKSYSV